MSKLILIFACLTLVPCAAVAGSLKDGRAAYDRRDFETAMELWRPLAEKGDVRAQFKVGHMYVYGEGVRQDVAEAIKWFRKAAEQGHSGAQYNLGIIHDVGRAVEKNPVEAAKWHRKAADQGVATAQFHLGRMYAIGSGLPHDHAQAYGWLDIAAKQEPNAQQYRDELAKAMTPEQIAEGQRMARDWLANRGQ